MAIHRILFGAFVAVAIASAAVAQDVRFDPNKEYHLHVVTWTSDVETEGQSWERLVRQYERFRPNVRIRKEIQSVRTYEAWATTQFKSGFAPDIMQSFPWKAHQWGAEQGHLVPLREYLNRPNPHDHRDPARYPTWMSCLYEELLEQNADPYFGEIWTIPTSLNTQRFYYNKDIFKRYDLQVPTTFSELGEVCRQIRQRSAGEVAPLAMPKEGAWLDYLGAAVNIPLIDEFDLIKRDAQVTPPELLVAARRGMWDARSKPMYAFSKLMKKMNDEGWFQDGWDGYDMTQCDNLFTNGGAAIIREGCWMKEGFRLRVAGAFEIGVMREPIVDRAFIAELADGDEDVGRMLELMASYGSEVAITQRCVDRGNLAAAIDFLQWMTSPEIAVQTQGAMPSTRDLDDEFGENVLAFKPEIGGRPGGPILYGVSRPMQECFRQVAPLYISGKKDLAYVKDFMGRLHDRFIDLEIEKTKESTRSGIFRAAQLYARFIYEQDELLRRAESGQDSGRLLERRRERLDLMGMTLDNLKNTEDNVMAMVADAWPGREGDGFRHVPMIDQQRGELLQAIGSVLVLVAGILLLVFLVRKNRLARMLGFPEKGIYVFLAPSLLFILAFSYYPALSGIYHAFTRWNGVNVDEFIGLANFSEMLTDDILAKSAGNLVWMLITFFLKLIPPLAIAVVLYHVASERLRYYFRVMFVLPLVVPGIVYWMVWKLLYQPAPQGVFNAILLPIEQWMQGLGWDVTLAHNWLADPRTALGAVIFLGFPWVNTLGVLIYLAGLENIDPNLFEAADVDGAGPLRKFFSIELPLLTRQIKLNLVLGLIGTIQNFGLVLFLTKGGPAYATTLPGYQMYNEAFTLNRMGYASAIGLAMFIVILVMTVATGRAVKPQD